VSPDDQTYAAAGVSLATAEAVVDRLRSAVDSTRTDAVRGSLGAFAGLYAIDEHRLLAASTDSVGSKLVLGRRAGRLRWCSADLARTGSTTLTTGAGPSSSSITSRPASSIPSRWSSSSGAAEVCRAAGCAILGGETAELPGLP
jgi:phosphoribosylformylglycinamidine cyclo-ligase